MIDLLEKALAEVAKLSEEEQDAIAAVIQEQTSILTCFGRLAGRAFLRHLA